MKIKAGRFYTSPTGRTVWAVLYIWPGRKGIRKLGDERETVDLPEMLDVMTIVNGQRVEKNTEQVPIDKFRRWASSEVKPLWSKCATAEPQQEPTTDVDALLEEMGI